jgi:glycosyltransferase involved in cell wall biosynthesis
MPLITAAICTYDRYDVLKTAVKSLREQDLDETDYQIIVVDNSPDEKEARQRARDYTSLSNLDYVHEQQAGLSNARNVAAQRCSSPLIAFMDDDAIADPAWLRETVRAFEQFGDDVGVVGGRVNPIWETPRPAWLSKKLEGYVSVVNWGGKLREAAAHEWFAGTNISFRVADLEAAGGFSTHLGRKGSGGSLLSNEESEVVDALRASGKITVYAPDASVDHLVEAGRLRREWFRKRVAWQATSDFIMDPEKTSARAQANWESLLDYISQLPPRERSIRALIYETDDDGLFAFQLGALYALTVLMLTGFDGVAP